MVMARSQAAYALAFMFVLCGCDSIDPTSQSFGITVENDTKVAIDLKLCADSSCRHFDYSFSWKPGHTAQVNISDRDVFTRWLVQDSATGQTLGCLPLRFDQKYADVQVRISQAVPCPGEEPLSVTKGKPEGQS
jgi:hypothetical protein